mgnify:CR=1 FL=1
MEQDAVPADGTQADCSVRSSTGTSERQDASIPTP